MTLKWSKPVGWACIILISTASVFLTYLVIADAVKKDAGVFVAIFLALLLLAWVGSELFLTKDRRYKTYLSSLITPWGVSKFGLVVIGGPLAISQALPLFDPGPLTKTDVETAVVKGLEKQAKGQISTARILSKIEGLWGEPGCKVAYRFSLAGQTGLAIDWERRPAQEKPWRATATIILANGDVIESRGETPIEEKGQAATFTYQTNGLNEKLVWDYQSGETPLELDKC